MDVKWIAVEDSLPTYGRLTLVKVEYANSTSAFAVGYCNNKGWRLSKGMLSVIYAEAMPLVTPTHWAYLR